MDRQPCQSIGNNSQDTEILCDIMDPCSNQQAKTCRVITDPHLVFLFRSQLHRTVYDHSLTRPVFTLISPKGESFPALILNLDLARAYEWDFATSKLEANPAAMGNFHECDVGPEILNRGAFQ